MPARLSVIVPTFSQAANIDELVGRVAALVDKEFGEHYEIVVVGDDSPHRPWELASIPGKSR
jgi:dolichol-phosphate mannosyltransferase